jgi:hypothetical protein
VRVDFIKRALGRGSTVRITHWTTVGIVDDAPTDLNPSWHGEFKVITLKEFDGVIADLELSDDDRRINLRFNFECSYDLEFTLQSKKRQDTSLAIGAPTAVGFSAAIADPHFVGPHGIKFDVSGKPNGVYTMFTSPNQFAIAMRLATDGPRKRFITGTHVTIYDNTNNRSTSLWLNVHEHFNKTWLQQINQQIEPFGARAAVNPHVCIIDMMNGVRFKVAQMHTGGKPSRQFLNVEFDVPGCNEAFGGILGQLYRCEYEDGVAKPFKWRDGDEEKFRDKRLEQH